jgi:hypothetical protein
MKDGGLKDEGPFISYMSTDVKSYRTASTESLLSEERLFYSIAPKRHCLAKRRQSVCLEVLSASRPIARQGSKIA